MTLSFLIRCIISGAIGWHIGGNRRKWGWSNVKSMGIAAGIAMWVNAVIILLLGL
jgi:hypothetical protein